MAKKEFFSGVVQGFVITVLVSFLGGMILAFWSLSEGVLVKIAPSQKVDIAIMREKLISPSKIWEQYEEVRK